MRIAFITYEFPPDTEPGGIATYVSQAATILKKRGHDVEIFCASHSRQVSEKINGIYIHRILTAGPVPFRKDCVPVFLERHKGKPFDIMESPEINANALEIKKACPDVPLVVRLHLPVFFQMRLLNYYTPWHSRLRFFLGALRRGRVRYFGQYDHRTDHDFLVTDMADGITAPSTAMQEVISSKWKIEKTRIRVLANLFEPPADLLELPIKPSTDKVVLFVGRLNVLKGIVNLTKAIKIVARAHSDVRFRLIGEDSYFQLKKQQMSDYIKEELSGFEDNFELMGPLSYNQVMDQYRQARVCVFPSLFESFGLACVESMSAGKPVVAGNRGGMKEICNGGAGILINPDLYRDLADKVMFLLSNDQKCLKLGQEGRARVLNHYNGERIGSEMERYYSEIMKSKRHEGHSFQ